MFVRKTAFEKLVKHVQNQQQEIEKLQEMLGILAQSQSKQFEFVVGGVIRSLRSDRNLTSL